MAVLKRENDTKATEEFELIAVNAPFTQHAAKLLSNKAKNRYENIVPCKFFQLHHWLADYYYHNYFR